MLYYNVEDIMELTGVKKSKGYEMIRNINDKFKQRYPNCESMQGKVPKWFFDEIMGFKKEEEKEN